MTELGIQTVTPTILARWTAELHVSGQTDIYMAKKNYTIIEFPIVVLRILDIQTMFI